MFPGRIAALLAAGALGSMRRGRRSGRASARAPAPPRYRVLWVRASAVLAAAYAVQETLEAAVAPGHPDGLAVVLGNGGWTAFLIAIALGALVALIARGADAALDRAAHRRARTPSARPRPSIPLPISAWPPPRRLPLARHLASRAPPRAA
jgi:hypothetical protein